MNNTPSSTQTADVPTVGANSASLPSSTAAAIPSDIAARSVGDFKDHGPSPRYHVPGGFVVVDGKTLAAGDVEGYEAAKLREANQPAHEPQDAGRTKGEHDVVATSTTSRPAGSRRAGPASQE